MKILIKILNSAAIIIWNGKSFVEFKVLNRSIWEF